MKHCCGSMSLSSILGVAGVLAVGVTGYTFLTGKSLCGMFGSCDKSAIAARMVAGAEEPSTCPMSAASQTAHKSGADQVCPASTTTVAATHSECSASDAVAATPVSASECPYMKAHQVAATPASSECPMSAKACTANAMPASRVRWTFAAGGTFGAPLVMPVFYSECGSVAYDCSAGGEAVTDEVVVVNASLVEPADHATAAGCCKAGGACPHDASACESATCDKANCPKDEAASAEKNDAKPATGE